MSTRNILLYLCMYDNARILFSIYLMSDFYFDFTFVYLNGYNIGTLCSTRPVQCVSHSFWCRYTRKIFIKYLRHVAEYNVESIYLIYNMLRATGMIRSVASTRRWGTCSTVYSIYIYIIRSWRHCINNNCFPATKHSAAAGRYGGRKFYPFSSTAPTHLSPPSVVMFIINPTLVVTFTRTVHCFIFGFALAFYNHRWEKSKKNLLSKNLYVYIYIYLY